MSDANSSAGYSPITHYVSLALDSRSFYHLAPLDHLALQETGELLRRIADGFRSRRRHDFLDARCAQAFHQRLVNLRDDVARHGPGGEHGIPSRGVVAGH